MLENAGVSLLTIHGRTRDQRGPNTGLADWQIIKKVKEALRVPVVANGNIQCLQHALDCMDQTGVDGIMTAEGNLYNPALFSGISPPAWKMATEYIEIARNLKRPALSCIRGHVFKILHHVFQQEEHRDMRDMLAQANGFDEIGRVAEEAKKRLENLDETNEYASPRIMDDLLKLPYWRCKPYVRPKPSETTENNSRKRNSGMIEENLKRQKHKEQKKAKYQEKMAKEVVSCFENRNNRCLGSATEIRNVCQMPWKSARIKVRVFNLQSLLQETIRQALTDRAYFDRVFRV